jgi:ornithine carbamoyltransferase
LAYVGDGNSVSHSLIYLAARLGVRLRIATPENYAPDADVIADSRRVLKPKPRSTIRRSSRSEPRCAGRIHRFLDQHGF